MGNSNTGFLGAVKWSRLIVAINGSKLERTGTIINLNQVSEALEVVGNIALLLILVSESHVKVGVHICERLKIRFLRY
jgi:hypothetical protein